MSQSKKSKKIYCGVDKLKENQKLGSAKECAELKQVRYYGLKKINKDLVEDNKGMPVKSKGKIKKLIQKRGMLRGKIEKNKVEIEEIKEDVDYKKNKSLQATVKKLEDELKKYREELKKVIIKLKELEKE
jgi:hypothetical protein